MERYRTLVRRSAWSQTKPSWASTKQRLLWAVGLLVVGAATYGLAKGVGLLPMTLEWADLIRGGIYSVLMALLLACLVVGGTFLVNVCLAPARLHREQEQRHHGERERLLAERDTARQELQRLHDAAAQGAVLRIVGTPTYDGLHFRLRVRNDGGPARPSVMLTRIVDERGTALQESVLPIELDWQDHPGQRPLLTNEMEGGLVLNAVRITDDHLGQRTLTICAKEPSSQWQIQGNVPARQRGRLWLQLTPYVDGVVVGERRWFGFEPYRIAPLPNQIVDWRAIGDPPPDPAAPPPLAAQYPGWPLPPGSNLLGVSVTAWRLWLEWRGENDQANRAWSNFVRFARSRGDRTVPDHTEPDMTTEDVDKVARAFTAS